MSDSELPPETPFPGEEADVDETGEVEEIIDRLRGTGVGVEDPNIVGNVGPTDVPPGQDPDGGLLADPPVAEEREA